MANEEFMIDTPEGIDAYLMRGLGRLPGIRVIRANEGGRQMAVRSDGTIRSGDDQGDTKAISLEPDGAQFVVQAGTPYAELTRLGGGFSAIATSAVAALVVRPTTVAAFGVWNGNSEGGKSYVIDRLFSHALVTTAAIEYWGIWACLHPAGMTDPGEDIAASATNVTGNSGKRYNGNAIVYVAETVVNNGWYPWGRGNQSSVTNTIPGAQADVEVAGRLIVPPQGGISLHVVAGITGITLTSGLSWYEVQLDLR